MGVWGLRVQAEIKPCYGIKRCTAYLSCLFSAYLKPFRERFKKWKTVELIHALMFVCSDFCLSIFPTAHRNTSFLGSCSHIIDGRGEWERRLLEEGKCNTLNFFKNKQVMLLTQHTNKFSLCLRKRGWIILPHKKLSAQIFWIALFLLIYIYLNYLFIYFLKTILN